VDQKVDQKVDHIADQKDKVKCDLKKERSQSVNMLPRKDHETIVNAARFTSPSFSPNFDPSNSLESPRLGEPPAPLLDGSPRIANPASLNDLDDLIDIFDDLADEPFEGVDEERMLEEYVNHVDNTDLSEEAANLIASELSPRFTYTNSPSDTPPLENGRPRSLSPPHPPTLSRHVRSAPNTPDGDTKDDLKMPGLRSVSTKRDVNPTNAGVRLGAVTSILEDALEGVEAGVVDSTLMKHYLTSALCILRTLS